MSIKQISVLYKNKTKNKSIPDASLINKFILSHANNTQTRTRQNINRFYRYIKDNPQQEVKTKLYRIIK